MLSEPWWRSGGLSQELDIKPSTLAGWRRRGWVKAKKLGSRWIYWADGDELQRLKSLATYPAGIVKPQELIQVNLEILDNPDTGS